MGLAGSHVLVGQKALNTLSDNAICAVWYGLIVAVASIFMSYNREWGKLHFLSGISVVCILVSAMITIVGTGVQSDNVLAKGRAPIKYHAFPQNPTLIDVIGGLTNIVFSYGGSLACLSLCSEMKKPNDFKKSFVMVQGSQAFTYVIVGAIVYAFGGQVSTDSDSYRPSPPHSSATSGTHLFHPSALRPPHAASSYACDSQTTLRV